MAEETNDEYGPDICHQPAPDCGCTLCGQPLKPEEPWIDWRWGEHDGCELCGPEGHDEPNPFHVECVQAFMVSGDTHPYMGDEPMALDDVWLTPTLWRAVWEPERVTVRDAQLAALVYGRLYPDYKDCEMDPAAMSPFDAVKYSWDSKAEFAATDCLPYARCLGLTEREAAILPNLLEPTRFGGWEMPFQLRRMGKEELADHIRDFARNKRVEAWDGTLGAKSEPSIWASV